MRPACLTAFIALHGFAVALAVFLAFFINGDSWSFRLPECSGPRTTPSFLQIQVLGDGNNSTREVVVDREKNPWVGELIKVLQQIQTKVNDDSAVSRVVLDPEQNTWIDEMINVLRDAGKSQCAAPDADVSSNSDGDNKSNREAGNHPVPSDDDNSPRDVVVDLKKPSWVDDLANTIRGVAEFRAIDPAIRAEVKQHMNCDGKRLTISDIIRFPIGESSLGDAAVDRMDNFRCRVGGQATDWRIFGFASGEGGKDMNRELSWQRACEVTKYICGKHGCEPCDIDCGKYPEDKGGEAAVLQGCAVPDGNTKSDLSIHFLGEEHFINGVADSRSAVIAACLGETTAQDVRPCGHAR